MVLLDLKPHFGEFIEGKFLERLNRFVVQVEVGGEVKKAHLSDTGRLGELLTPGAPVLLSPNPKGKLDYKFVAVEKEGEWVLLNTSVHSKIARRVLETGLLGFKPRSLKAEHRFGGSRIDFLVEGNLLLEVKGCNLVEDGVCLFPDAPTERGRRHLGELLSALKGGYRAAVLFLAFRKCNCFLPNEKRDPDFSAAFYEALDAGVEFYAVQLEFRPDGKVLFKKRLNLCS